MSTKAKSNKLTFPEHVVVVIDTPIASPAEMGLDCCPHRTLYTTERFLPKILVEANIFPSTSEVRKNRRELVRTLDHPDWLTLRFGHRVVDVLVGLSPTLLNS